MLRRSFFRTTIGLVLSILPLTAAAEPSQNVKDAIDAIVLMCVAGGTKYDVEVRGGVEGGLALKKFGATGSGEIKISRSEARGLVEGLQNVMSKIASEQASAARDCMRPYIDRILKQILGDAGDTNFYMEHRLQHLTARLENFTVSANGLATARISLRNTDTNNGLAICLKAEHSDGIADFWKFFPRSLAVLSDNKGAQYRITEISPLGYARTPEDWTMILPGQITTLTASFQEEESSGHGKRYDLSIPIRMAWKSGGSNQQIVSNFDLYFKGIQP